MRLYLVTDRRIATALIDNLPLNWTHSLVLDDLEGGTVCVPSLVFYDFPWLRELIAESEEPHGWDKWVELAVDFPDEVVKPQEVPCSEGGNSTWYLPQALVRQFIARVARPGEPKG